MRWIALIFTCAVLSTSLAEPDPKKYKPETRNKPAQATNSSLTDDERKFLREVEAKFGIKADVLAETKKDNDDKNKTGTDDSTVKPPFPAVIAIEIVNDTDTKSKNGKRTIDANLGYGYKTNNGYAYSYLGRPSHEMGKFMIYPYSQQDIPPRHPNQYQLQQSSEHSSYTTSSPSVNIQPSKAYELVEMQDEAQPYHYDKPEQQLNYDSIKGFDTPPVYTPQSHQQPIQTSTPTTLYTTYNGHQLSGLSGQFPMVMSNYFVDPSQLLKYPQFQSAGLSQDHLRQSGSPLQEKVVPVLVLRVPSSYLKNPTAELYANLPQNYPLSQYLNHVNLQELVNNYFKKIGYSFAPQVMAYQSPLLADPSQAPASTPVTHYERQHYATPYIQKPSYTQSDYSGVQYSAVKPVMAKYPLSYSHSQYYSAPQTAYQQPAQQYQYNYQYVPRTGSQQTYYIQQQSQQQAQQVEHEHQSEQAAVSQQAQVHDTASQVEYGHQQEVHATPAAPSVEYGTPETHSESSQASVQPVASQYEAPQHATQEYAAPKEESVEYVSNQPAAEYGPTRVNLPVLYTTSPEVLAQYGLSKQGAHQETIAVYPSQSGHIPRHYSSQADAGAQYYYQTQVTGDNENNNLALTENYPSKDHTIATVLPYSYKQARKPSAGSVQSVSYVTPMPFSSKYQSQYRIMVPQMIFKNPNSEKVSYVNSHSLPYSQSSQEHNPEAEYTVPSHFVPPVGRQKPPSYPKNYHSHPKRMAKPEPKSEERSHSSVSAKKKSEQTEKKNA